MRNLISPHHCLKSWSGLFYISNIETVWYLLMTLIIDRPCSIVLIIKTVELRIFFRVICPYYGSIKWFFLFVFEYHTSDRQQCIMYNQFTMIYFWPLAYISGLRLQNKLGMYVKATFKPEIIYKCIYLEMVSFELCIYDFIW